MAAPSLSACRVRTIAQAKARLSKVMRLAEKEGPQHVGKTRPFVVVPAGDRYAKVSPRRPVGEWLVDNLPRGANLDVPADRKSGREIPFISDDTK